MVATVAYTYLGLNNVVRADYEEPDVRWDLITGSGANPYTGLDRFGRVTDCLWRKYSATAADLARLKYGYNRDSSRQWREDDVAPSGFDEFYTYDAVQRLIDMDRGTLTGSPTPTGVTSPTLGQDWTLDATGNWKGFNQTITGAVTQTRTSNMDNEITAISGGGWQTPAYNDAGAMLGMPNAGSSPTPARIAQYDAWGRLTSITSGFTLAATFVYDGLNRRVIKNTQSGSTITATRHHYYSDQWQVLEERVGSATTADRQYVWGLRYVDDLVLRDRDTGSGNERLYSMQDDNWNVVAICNASAAAVQERYTYTPYGMVEFLNPSFGSIGSSGFTWNYLFTGRERDTESALQLNRNRYYHPRLGCWITRDPIGYGTRDLNLYRYVSNSAVSVIDPSGLEGNCWRALDINVFLWSYGTFTTQPVREEVAEANRIFKDCCITVRLSSATRMRQATTESVLTVQNDYSGQLAAFYTGTPMGSAMRQRAGNPPGAVAVHYVQRIGPPAQGMFEPQSGIVILAEIGTARLPRQSWVLAHELVHALGIVGHNQERDPQNLMIELGDQETIRWLGLERRWNAFTSTYDDGPGLKMARFQYEITSTPRRLSQRQCQQIRQSPLLKPVAGPS